MLFPMFRATLFTNVSLTVNTDNSLEGKSERTLPHGLMDIDGSGLT